MKNRRNKRASIVVKPGFLPEVSELLRAASFSPVKQFEHHGNVALVFEKLTEAELLRLMSIVPVEAYAHQAAVSGPDTKQNQ